MIEFVIRITEVGDDKQTDIERFFRGQDATDAELEIGTAFHSMFDFMFESSDDKDKGE